MNGLNHECTATVSLSICICFVDLTWMALNLFTILKRSCITMVTCLRSVVGVALVLTFLTITIIQQGPGWHGRGFECCFGL